ncbi:MAG: O-antigen ligase family protein [Solirubrobacteraceae bacterium]|nr:O-antigen ligase family protein [Solirubrobacteraceae bacterium]
MGAATNKHWLPAFTIAGVLGAALYGAAVAQAPMIALPIGLVLAVALAVAAFVPVSASPKIAGATALLLLTIYPPKLFGGGPLAAPELQKGLLVACWVGAASLRGVNWPVMMPALVLAPLALLSGILGQAPEGLTALQTVSSYVTLSLGWSFLAVRWRPSDALFLLRILALAPLVSVGLGILLSAAGLIDLFRETSVARLGGASIAALLGGIGAAGIGASITLSELRTSYSHRLNLVLFAVNWLIVVATASRGPMLIGAILTLPWFIRLTLRQARADGLVAAVRLGLGLTALVAALAVTIPAIQARNDSQTFNAATGTVSTDATSGRLTAWKEFLKLVEPSPVFGLGVGAGPIAKIGESGFEAQHNEYLRSYLETGAVGLLAMLLAAFAAFGALVRRVPRAGAGFMRRFLVWQIAAFALYSLTDNTLSSPYLSVSLMTLIATTAVVARPGQKGIAQRT